MATTDRSGRTQCQAEKTGNIEQTTAKANMGTRRNKKKTVQSSATCGGKRQWCLGSFEHIVPSHAWQDDVEVSVNNA